MRATVGFGVTGRVVATIGGDCAIGWIAASVVGGAVVVVVVNAVVVDVVGGTVVIDGGVSRYLRVSSWVRPG